MYSESVSINLSVRADFVRILVHFCVDYAIIKRNGGSGSRRYLGLGGKDHA